MKSFILSIILLCSMYFSGIAQNISISGQVIDENKNPIDYAVIAVQNISDSTMISSCQTMDGGKFILSVPNKKSKIDRKSVV